MTHLRLENITKRFASLTALRDVNLEIHDQEFLVLVGPTGAGKTTSLRCTAGLEQPDEGTIYLDDEVYNDVAPAERDVSFVFQNYALYPRKRVYDNVAFPLVARKVNQAQVDVAVKRVTNMLHIDHLLDRYPRQLSGGEQQRVALARAMVRQPRLFLMDEPLTNLDFKLRTQMRGELKRLQQELAATFFYVTNDQLEALSLGDRIAVLNHGELQQIGPSQEVYEHPVNLFVAGFIGSTRMNFLNCVYDNNGERLLGKDDSWQIDLTADQSRPIRAQDNRSDLILGVRPEDLHFSGVEGCHLQGEVFVAEPLGDRIIYDVRIGDAAVKVKAPPTRHHNMGDVVSLKLNLARAHIFDRRNGAALC